MPAVFFGHGNPMNALVSNRYTEAWRGLGLALPRPKAVLAISAHWYVPQTGVTVSTSPRTIHDFGGFPSELYQVKYPAPGDTALARRVQELLSPLPVRAAPLPVQERAASVRPVASRQPGLDLAANPCRQPLPILPDCRFPADERQPHRTAGPSARVGRALSQAPRKPHLPKA